MVADRERINVGDTATPLDRFARAHATVALVPSADIATVGVFELNPGAERSAIPPQEVFEPVIIPVLVRTVATPPVPLVDQTAVT